MKFKRSKSGNDPCGKGFLYRIAERIAGRLRLSDPDGRNQHLNEQIAALSGGRRDAVREYHTRKTAEFLLLGFAVTVMGVLILVLTAGSASPVREGRLARNDYGGNVREENLLASVEGETQLQEIDVAVSPRKYSRQEADRLLELAKEAFIAQMPGSNPSVDEVRTPLSFPARLQDGLVQAEYLTIPYGMIDETGAITGEPDPEGSLVEIQVTFTCQEQTLLYETVVNVLPPVRSRQQQLGLQLGDAAGKANRRNATETWMQLPGSVDGKTVTWMRPVNTDARQILPLLFLLPFLLYFARDYQIQEKAKERSRQLALDYGDLVWKMTMLLGAGLTIRGAFMRIAASYQGNAAGRKRYVYEEMLYTCREMQTGVPEGQAYENFGRRCSLPEYVKLSAILSQYLKKGSKGLEQQLLRDSSDALELRKNTARKLGEQAGTKMLFPMILMLGVVLMILIIPAFLSV